MYTVIIAHCYDTIDRLQIKRKIATKCDIMVITTKPKNHKELFSMSIITSEAHFRQRVVKYYIKNSVTAASIRFRRS